MDEVGDAGTRGQAARRSTHAAADDLDWQDAGKPGVRVKSLYADPQRGERTLLFELAPGARSAPHSHAEFEQVFVIAGSFHDGERWLRAGDYCSRAPGEVHAASTEEGATALVIYTRA